MRKASSTYPVLLGDEWGQKEGGYQKLQRTAQRHATDSGNRLLWFAAEAKAQQLGQTYSGSQASSSSAQPGGESAAVAAAPSEEAAVERILARLAQPLATAAHEAVVAGFAQLTPVLVSSVAEAVIRQEAARDQLGASVSPTSEESVPMEHRCVLPGILAAGSADRRSPDPLARVNSGLESSCASEQSEGDMRVKGIRALQDDLASRVLEESCLKMAQSANMKRRTRSKLALGGPSNTRVSTSQSGFESIDGDGSSPAPSREELMGKQSRSSGDRKAGRKAEGFVAFQAPEEPAPRLHGFFRRSGSKSAVVTAEVARSSKVSPSPPSSGQLPADSFDEEQSPPAPPHMIAQGSDASPSPAPPDRKSEHASTQPPLLSEDMADRALHCGSVIGRSISCMHEGKSAEIACSTTGSTSISALRDAQPLASLDSIGRGMGQHPSRLLTNSEVLECRVRELTEIIPYETQFGDTGDDGGFDETRRSRLTLCFERTLHISFQVSGILSWGRPHRCPHFVALYKGFVITVLICIFLWFASDVTLTRSRACLGSSSFRVGCGIRTRLVTEVLMTFAAASLIALLGGLRGARRLDDLISMLQGYAFHHDLADMWHRYTIRDVSFMMTMFIGAVAAIAAEMVRVDRPLSTADWLHAGVTVAEIGVMLLGFTFILYVLRILIVTVDVFCYQSVQHPNISEATESWNILQALLRKASTTVELGLLVLLALAALTVPAFVLDHAALGSYLETFRRQLPYILLECGVLRVFVVAAAITDKCMRVPALINSLSFGIGKERERQHLVEYIAHSAAGFYICDIRLSLGMVTKFVYVWSVILFSFVGRELTSD